MGYELSLARSILHSNERGQRRVSKPAIRIATLGVAIGMAVMIIAVAVVVGFKSTIRNKVVGISSHIQVENLLTTNNSSDPYPIVVSDSLMKSWQKVPGIEHAQRITLTRGILKTDDDFLGVCFKGIAEEYDTTFLHANLVEGSIPHFSSEKSSNKLLLSQEMSRRLHLKTGDKIMSYFISRGTVRMRKFTISGIYCTNMVKYDQIFCFTDLSTCRRLNDWEGDMCSGAEIQCEQYDSIIPHTETLAAVMKGEVDEYGQTYSIRSIFDTNPQIFAWLDLLDLNVWIILGLMLCVAVFTMVSGLLIIILERTQLIGTLKALGARNMSVQRLFLWFGIFIIGRGILLGDIIAVALAYVQDKFGIITLDPQTYYVETVPVQLNWMHLLLINAGTLAVSAFVLIVPSMLVSHISPAKSIRFE